MNESSGMLINTVIFPSPASPSLKRKRMGKLVPCDSFFLAKALERCSSSAFTRGNALSSFLATASCFVADSGNRASSDAAMALGGLERSIAEAAAGDADASRLTSVALRFARGFFAAGFFGDVMVAVSIVEDGTWAAFIAVDSGGLHASKTGAPVSLTYLLTLDMMFTITH